MKWDVEWLDAPGVEDVVLRATWARIRVTIDGADLFDLVDLRSKSQRYAVYGATFPIVEWLIENWWNLLYEPSPSSPFPTGRDAPAWSRAWFQRHNLLAAREGGALPDATFARDGDEIVVRWDPDPAGESPSRVHFVGRGFARVDASEFIRAAAEFITTTLERVRDVAGDDEDANRALEAWTVIRASDAEERRICRSLAVLGVDPYDPDPSTDELVNVVTRLSDTWPVSLCDDLLEGAHASTAKRGSLVDLLNKATDWLADARLHLATETFVPTHATLHHAWTPSAHRTGYELARRTRTELMGLGPRAPIRDLEEVLVSRLGWDESPLRHGQPVQGLAGLVGPSAQSGKPTVVDALTRSDRARRFLLARSAFFLVSGSLGQGRLLTPSVTRPQRAARAFAAELLAPAEALADRVSGAVSQDELDDLAHEFDVNPLLLKHQIENHRLGFVSA